MSDRTKGKVKIPASKGITNIRSHPVAAATSNITNNQDQNYCESSEDTDIANASTENPQSRYSHPSGPNGPPANNTASGKIDLRKEYNRFCKLYSSEPLDIMAGPLEKASYRNDSVELDLKGRGLRGVDCIALGKILITNSTIHHLNLSDCHLRPQGFQAVLDGLGKNTHLQILELKGNNIQAGMVEHLGTFLKLNKTLKQLILDWNCMGTIKASFQVFCEGLSCNKGLEFLDLRNNQIQDDTGVELANALKLNTSLLILDIRWNSIGIQGARALCEVLKYNKKLRKLDLCGNFVPEEIIEYIQATLSQKGEKEEIIEDYSKRTTILTRKLQKTEEDYKSEISSMVSLFEDEESELRQLIREGQQELGRVEKELYEEKLEKQSLVEEINNVKQNLESSKENEEVLKQALQISKDQIIELEQSIKSIGTELGSKLDAKISKVAQDAELIQQENDRLVHQLKETGSLVKEKESEISILNNRIISFKENAKRSEELFEERLKKEKENWLNWKTEVESNEHQETKRLEHQLIDIQRAMQDHVKTLEAKRLEAEEEVNRLRITLLTAKTEAEDNMTRLRNLLNEEHQQAVQGLLSQIEALKQTVNTLELQGKRLDSIIRKIESDNELLIKQNDHLKQQAKNMEEDLQETREKGQVSLQKVKNDCRQLETELAKETESNKTMRSQVFEMQEQIAILSTRLSRAIQEKQSENEYWKGQVDRRDVELKRIKEEDMRRASLLHDSFLVYMKSTSAATGLPVPQSCTDFFKSVGLPQILNPFGEDIELGSSANKMAQGDGSNK